MATLVEGPDRAKNVGAEAPSEWGSSDGDTLAELHSKKNTLSPRGIGVDSLRSARGLMSNAKRTPALCMPPREEDETEPRDEGATRERPLAGRHVIVPASRVARNVLADLLTKQGARVTVFPEVRAVPPTSFEALDTALAAVDRLQWIVLSGEHSVLHFHARACHHGRGSLSEIPCRLCAIGVGAVQALWERGRKPDVAPRDHRPSGIVEALGPLQGGRLLLVREETAADDLPERLRALSGEVLTAAGYRVEIVATHAKAARAFRYRPDMLALPSPSSARYFVRAATGMGLDIKRCLGGVTVAAVGLATAAEAERLGLTPDLVSCGRLSTLARDLVCLYGSDR